MKAGMTYHANSASRRQNGSYRSRSSGPSHRTYASHRLRLRIPPAPRQSGESRVLRSAFPLRQCGESVCGLLWSPASPPLPVLPESAWCRQHRVMVGAGAGTGLRIAPTGCSCSIRLSLASHFLLKRNRESQQTKRSATLPSGLCRFRRLGAQHRQTSSSVQLGNYIAVALKLRKLSHW